MKAIAGKVAAVIMAVIFCIFTACKENSGRYSEFYALDTYITVTHYSDVTDLSFVEEYIRQYEELFSVTDKNSDIYKLNADKKAKLSPKTAELIRKANEISELTNGKFDITVYPAVKAWGFTTDNNRIPDKNELSQLKKNIDYTKISLKDDICSLPREVSIDLGGCAKGYIGDKCAEFLKEKGINSAVISLGGNIRTVGRKPDGKPWQIGVQYPDSGKYYGIISVEEANIISSGAYQRNFKGEDGKLYHHIIAPDTASPAESDIKEATVICADGTKADCLSTALFVMGLDEAIKFYKQNSDFEVMLLSAQDELYISEGIYDSFILSDEFSDMQITIISRGEGK